MATSKPGSRKKVTVENLVGLGAERLAQILLGVAETRADLKRRVRMELAAEEGPAALAAEIDRRLVAFETSRGKITWRQRPAFVRDLDSLRELIAQRLAPLEETAAIERLWRFIDTAKQAGSRTRDGGAQFDPVFQRAAADLGRLAATVAPGPLASSLVDAMTRNPTGWKQWLPAFLEGAPEAAAKDALRSMIERRGPVPSWIVLVRQLADAAKDVEAYRATWDDDALQRPAVAAELARRYLAADRVEPAGDRLRAFASAATTRRGKAVAPDFDWETQWIDYLERADRAKEAEAVRWSSFQRTLSAERLRDILARLGDFDDVEAEQRAFSVASDFGDARQALNFLMDWPALGDAAAMIGRRTEEIDPDPETAERWAATLRRRYPKAAHTLLRRAAAGAFRRREFKTCDRLTAEADTIEV